MAGVLDGITIIEMAGIGPGPFAGMMLADHGARVIRVARVGALDLQGRDVLTRNREVVEIDTKTPEGVAQVRALVKEADGLFEGFRPGVMERMGLGPDLLLADNPKLVYGRMTGRGQTGPLAQAAGHDINYISITGNLHGYGRPDGKPTPPTNAIGDFAGGGMMGGGISDLGGYSDGGRLLRGPGDGVSDSIPASINNKQPARLADGEFVVPARIVSELGNGSTEAGARKLYAMMDRIQKSRRKAKNIAANTRADKHLPA